MAHKVYQPTMYVPEQYYPEIGRIVTLYAYAEHRAQYIIHRLVRLNPTIARITINEPRLDERVELIGQLAHLRKIPISEATIKRLKNDAEEIKFTRDIYAHGLWLYDVRLKRFLIYVTRGKKETQKPPGMSRFDWNRKVRPSGMIVKIEDMHMLIEDLKVWITEIEALRVGIRDFRRKPKP